MNLLRKAFQAGFKDGKLPEDTKIEGLYNHPL